LAYIPLTSNQGAAQAIEDGATLAECVARARNTNDLPAVLKVFQIIRKPRCEKIQKGSMENGDIWHMPDGPEQVARDADMKVTMEKLAAKEAGTPIPKESKVVKSNPNRWSDEEFQPWLFGHDAIAHVCLPNVCETSCGLMNGDRLIRNLMHC
jgi:salicylate hydroxylase